MSSKKAAVPAGSQYPLGKIALAFVITVVVSTLLNYLVFWLTVGPFGIESNFGAFANPAGVGIFNALYLIIAAVVFWVISRRAANVPKAWGTVAAIGFVVSLLPNVMGLLNLLPPELGTPSVPAMLSLVVMHVVSYLVALYVFPRYGKA